MAKKTKLNIKQQAVMGKLVFAHQEHRREVEGIMSLEDDAWKFIDNFDDYCYRYYEEWKNEERLLCQNN